MGRRQVRVIQMIDHIKRYAYVRVPFFFFLIIITKKKKKKKEREGHESTAGWTTDSLRLRDGHEGW